MWFAFGADFGPSEWPGSRRRMKCLACVGRQEYDQDQSQEWSRRMLHVVKIEDREKLGQALDILNFAPGTWHSRLGYMLLPDAHHRALVKAGIIPPKGNGQKANGKKA